MKYSTWLFKYFITKVNSDKYAVVRICWLWPIPTRYLNRYGQRDIFVTYFESEQIAEIRLKKFLQNEGLF